MNFRRLLAYIIDVGLIIILLMFLRVIFPNQYQQDLNNLNDQHLRQEITYAEYINEYIIINHNVDKSDFWFNIIGIILMIFSFNIIPLLNNGQTIGKKLFKLRIKKIDGNLNLEDLIKRSIIINGMGYMLVVIILAHMLSAFVYFHVITLISIIQIVLIIISGIRICNNKKGIHDVLSGTEVINK